MQSKEEGIRQTTYGSVLWAKAGMATSIIVAAMISPTVSTNKTRFTRSYLLAFCEVAGCAAGSARPIGTHLGGGVLSLYPSSLEQEA
jgi:hypothetical protein